MGSWKDEHASNAVADAMAAAAAGLLPKPAKHTKAGQAKAKAKPKARPEAQPMAAAANLPAGRKASTLGKLGKAKKLAKSKAVKVGKTDRTDTTVKRSPVKQQMEEGLWAELPVTRSRCHPHTHATTTTRTHW